jgi:hypothetical protein
MMKVIVVMALLAVAAFASHPRLTVLGGDARLLVNDYLEMWAYPGVVGDYQFVTAASEEGDDMTDGWFGITKNFGDATFGVTVNHNDYMHEFIYSPGSWGAILSVDYNKEYVSFEGSEVYETETEIGLAWGTGIDLFGDYTDLAFGVGYGKVKWDIENIDPYMNDFNMGASVRGHQDAFFNLFPIISAGFSQASMGSEDYESSMTDIVFDLGAGHNQMIAPKTNLVAGAFVGVQSRSFGGDGNEDMDSELWIAIPRLSGAVEQNIGKWLVLRAGATSQTQYHSYGDDNALTTSFQTNFGLGLKWDNFILDATIGEEVLHDGIYMVGGNSNGFLGSVAATYTF